MSKKIIFSNTNNCVEFKGISFGSLLLNFFLVGNLILFFPTFSFAGANEQTGYKKEEVLFLKWGSGNNEVGFSKKIISEEEIKEGHKIPADIQINVPTGFGIDGQENFYIEDPVNNRIQVFSKAGIFLRSIPGENLKVKGMQVGEDGDIYLKEHSKDFKTFYAVRISKGNNRKRYKATANWHITKNKIYDSNEKLILTMEDKQENVGKSIRPLFLIRNIDFEYQPGAREIRIKILKINEHLKSLKKNNKFNDLNIPVVRKKNLSYDYANIDVLGVDDDGSIYLKYSFYRKHVLMNPNYPSGVQEEDVYIYSPKGVMRGEIPLPLNQYGNGSAFSAVKLLPEGDVYHMWVSKDGVRIYKWVNK